VVGLIASQNTDAGKATQDGFIGAAAIGLIGAPLAFFPRSDSNFAGPVYPRYAIDLPLGLPGISHTRRIPRLHLLR
jgi:hypothetical protein